MYPLLSAAVVGALAEIGDKSQFMLFVLSFRFRNETIAVVGGMVAALTISLVPAALAGAWFAARVDPTGLHWALAVLFLGMVGLALLTDHARSWLVVRGGGVFATVVITLLVAEIGDKSQLASALSSADNGLLIPLVGTLIGAWMVDLPVAIAGPWLAERLVSKGISLLWICRVIALPFAVLALIELSRLLV